MNKHKQAATTADFDSIFDEGREDITSCLDLTSATRINRVSKRVNVDFPAWMVSKMDKEAARIGITRQAFIKVVIAERIS